MSAQELTEPIGVRAAKEFLKNALLIDDKPFFTPKKITPKVAEKSSDGFGERKTVESEGVSPEAQTSAEETAAGRTEVDAQILTEAFLKQGMVCGIYKPPQPADQNELTEFLQVCENVDVVIVDWHLNQNHSTEQAKKLIENILLQDLRSPRLRLICVYTSQQGLEDLTQELLLHLKKNAKLRFCEVSPDNPCSIGDGDLLKIVFANKGRIDPIKSSDFSFQESDLPEWLVSEFAKLSRGLLRTACLGAVAAVRTGIPNLLSHFPPTVDGAYMGHRLMIPEADDSNSFLEGLICDELRNIISDSKAIKSFAGCEASSEWLKEQSQGEQFDTKCGLKIPVKWLEEIHAYVAENPDTYRKAIIALLEKWLSEQNEGETIDAGAVFDDIPLLFFTDKDSFMKSMLQFGELQSTAKAYKNKMFIDTEVAPFLMQGSVLAPHNNDALPFGLKAKYRLLCVQPPCDCVRMKAGVSRRFPFLILSPDKARPTFIVDGKGYSADFKPSNQVILTFKGTEGNSVVRAKREADEWIFESSDITCKLVATLKPMHAQKATSALASRSTNIGFDEFEWLRIRSQTGR